MVEINARCKSLREQYGDNWRCERPTGHPGKHRNEQGELMWDDAPATPQRCRQRYTIPKTSTEYTCTLAAGHFGEFHLDADQVATWSRAGDLVRHGSIAHALARGAEPTAQHDACGARLTVNYPTGDIPRTTRVCALGPHDFNEHHRATDGTQWRATDFPPTAPTASAVTRSAVDGIVRHLESMAAVFGELRDALCTGCREVATSSHPEAGAELEIVPGCPVRSP